ncbi:MAG: SDR family oxidoreductase [SAR202 cluster bacterium]|jgi:NAD(P)-dependent dehydrogenase (short-subunit alcohol dehydrogenase family)|nr:MAG: SDR family oxidoreductase [SAR202 cluster bacterium]MCH2526237.1 SDR family oxidoreductase [Dehalococcoidia bacterium]GIS82103.1 MAG: short-chain dehydrogenase [Dehalococcoidia bacterium]|tara:strand:- start:245 stop:1039 length:795 start_codon:yes stop_codon:yes gene_type:complete
MENGINGKVALITGGSMGIGKSTALALAREGAKIAICARGMDALKETAREIQEETGATVVPIRADMTSTEDITMLVWSTISELGHIDILVNNAVNSTTARASELPDEVILNHINTKVMGYIRCSREVITSMRKKGGGRIVNIAGMGARNSSATNPGSGITNSGVSAYTKCLSDDVSSEGILVNCIHPGSTRTQRQMQLIDERAQRDGVSSEEVMSRTVANVPIGRMVEPDDIANLVLFLVSNQASAITGQTIAVDGGAGRGIIY